MQPDAQEQHGADSPQRHGVQRVVEKCGIAIDLVGIAGVDLEVPEEVTDDIAEEHDSRGGHDGFFADRRLIEMDGPAKRGDCDGTHKETLDWGEAAHVICVITPILADLWKPSWRYLLQLPA